MYDVAFAAGEEGLLYRSIMICSFRLVSVPSVLGWCECQQQSEKKVGGRPEKLCLRGAVALRTIVRLAMQRRAAQMFFPRGGGVVCSVVVVSSRLVFPLTTCKAPVAVKRRKERRYLGVCDARCRVLM